MNNPEQPKIYHIAHMDRFPLIIKNGLRCDAEMMKLPKLSTTTGFQNKTVYTQMVF